MKMCLKLCLIQWEAKFEPVMQAEKGIMLQNRGYHDLRFDESGREFVTEIHAAA